MPTPYENLASYLRPEHPKEYASEAGIGNQYHYRTTTTTINANKPAIGDVWADGRRVVQTQCYEINAGSAISELFVQTGVTYGAGEIIGTVLEQTFTNLHWRPVLMPLECHPAFRHDGELALDVEFGTGDDAHTGYQDIMGWRGETDPSLKANLQYRILDRETGEVGGAIDVGDNAEVFIGLVLAGVEEYTDYLPVWRKRSIYRGSTAPGTNDIGMKADPSGPGFPSGYEWVKSADNVERVGTRAKWQRDEEWEGCIRVFADKGFIYGI